MPVEIHDKGEYELFETPNNNRILSLNGDRWFAWVEGQAGEILVHSDSKHKKDRTLQKGKFYALNFKEDPKYKDMPHLFLEKDGKFNEVMIPQGLPTQSDKQKKVVMTDQILEMKKLEDYIQNPAEAGPGEDRTDRPSGSSISNVTHYLRGINFPANREELVEHAKSNDAPGEITDQLNKLARGSKHNSMNDLTRAIGERTWSPPIENYDRLDVGQIENRIGELDRDEVQELKKYESENKNRKTLMQALYRKLDE